MKIVPSIFASDRDKIIAVTMSILTLFFMFVPALLVVFLLKEYVSENTYQLAKALLNLELLLFLISLFFAIPIIGWALGIFMAPLICIFNVVLVIIILGKISKGEDIKIPVPYEFI